MAYHYDEGGDNPGAGNISRGSQGSTMDRSYERGNAGSMQKRDMGSRSPLTTQKDTKLCLPLSIEISSPMPLRELEVVSRLSIVN